MHPLQSLSATKQLHSALENHWKHIQLASGKEQFEKLTDFSVYHAVHKSAIKDAVVAKRCAIHTTPQFYLCLYLLHSTHYLNYIIFINNSNIHKYSAWRKAGAILIH